MKQKIITMRGVLSAIKLTALALLSIGLMLPFMSSSVSAAVAPVVDEIPIDHQPNSLGSAIALGPDGAMWITAGSEASMQRVAADGTVTTYTVPSESRGITAGPDNAMWFTMPGINSIGRIAMDGTVTQFAIPTANSNPYSITLGSDGALWFTQTGTRTIGRVTTAGVFSEFPVPNAQITANIVAGPDGALWITNILNDDTNHIARMTVDGTITQFDTTNFATSITVGPDNAIWYASQSGTIGRMALDGTIQEFAGPTAPAGTSLSLNAISSGPDSALWIAYSITDSQNTITAHFARLNTDGTIVPIDKTLEGRFADGGASVGPNDTVWFTMNARAAGSPIVVRISLQDIPSVAPTAATDPAAQLAYTGQPMSIIAGIATVTVIAGIALAITARRRAHA